MIVPPDTRATSATVGSSCSRAWRISGPNGQSRDLPKGGPLEVRDQLLTELPRDATALVAPPGRVELTLLDDEAQAEADQRGARQEDRRQEEQDLSPVEL